jgi:hypothetical protein
MSDNREKIMTLQHVLSDTSLWLIFALAGGAGASVLALGMLLRSGDRLTSRAVMGTVLHSVAWGAAVFLMLVEKLDLGLPLVLGLSIFSGLGTASFIDLLLLLLKQRLGINVTINPPPKE